MTETPAEQTPAGPAPTRAALTRYRVLAWATGVFLLLLTAEVVLKYGFDTDIGSWIPIVHGWLYLAYVVVAADLWFRTRLPAGGMLLVLIAGTVPLASFAAERWVTRRVTPLLGPVGPGAADRLRA